ncbi:MAG TPA: hypothetical protein VM580_08620, partial [Labilithrix sp.]|nr:hypothetical protein [Labilithrix sp.]
MRSFRHACLALLIGTALGHSATASAEPARPPATSTPAPAPKAAPQGVAVVATNVARDDAFALAREVYASSLR